MGNQAAAGSRPGSIASGGTNPAAPESPDELRELIVRCARLLERALLTVTALPDKERGYLSGPKSSMPRPAPEPNVSYDNEAAQAALAKSARFRPTRADLNRYEQVLGWLTWLKRQGEDGELGARLIVYRAFGDSWWRLAQRMRLGRSDDTARRWHDAAVAAIAIQFATAIAAMDIPQESSWGAFRRPRWSRRKRSRNA